jgi:hypothetical protein
MRDMSPQELRDRAARKVTDLGPTPPTPRNAVRWRERRDSALLTLAALADWDAALLRQAAQFCHKDSEALVRGLLFEACGYCPNDGPGGRR